MSILRRVHIKSFKSIVDQSVELGQLNVFIGENGSGKTNFLEAIGMLSTAVSGEIDYSRLAQRGMRLSSPEIFRSAFKNKKRKITFMVEGEFADFLYHANITSVPEDRGSHPFRYHAEKLRRGENLKDKIAGRSNKIVGIDGAPWFKKDSLQNHQSIVSPVEALGRFTKYEQKALTALKNYAIYAPSTPILRGVSNDESRRSPLGLYGGSMASALSDVLKSKRRDQLLDFFDLLDWFRTVGTRRTSRALQSSHLHTGRDVVMFSDQFMSLNFNQLLAYDVSEGALYVLFVLLLLMHGKTPNIFALDNVDNALNPSLVTNLVRYISDTLQTDCDKQVFMTTHNPTTLDGIDLFNPKHRLFVVKRAATGDTVFERITPPKGMSRKQWAKKFGFMKLSDIWLSGVIAGIGAPGGF